jgi:uncharacterized membrane protein YccC
MLTLQSGLRWAIFLPKTPRLMNALTVARAPLLFSIRLWASVCLALFVAFWLELDNPFWAGTSAAIVCYPQLGASLRKGWFRMIGTVIGATMIIVLTAWFPQDRIAFLVLLALWGGICAFVGSLLRNFASYSAALAGYTAIIIAADNLGATGGPNADIFLLAVWRASEICIGIACAGIVLAGTDLGGGRRRLALSFASLAAEVTSRFTRMLALAGPQLPDTQTERRELVRRAIALDPMIDQALGESSYVRYRSSILQGAVHGVALAHRPAVSAVFTAMAVNFMPLLSPTNQMNYNTVQFYNAALAIVAGCSVAPLAFRLLPLPSSEVRARRFLALTLRDMRRLAVASQLPRLQDWEGLVYGRLAALPDQAEPLQRSRLLAALSVGTEIIHLRHIVPRLGAAADLDAALQDIARGSSAFAVARLRQLDRRLASGPDTGLESAIGVRARSRILIMTEALSHHASYFDAGGNA